MASVVGVPSVANAEKLFDLSGSVGLADGKIPTGTTVRLGADLNRNSELESFETLKGTVDEELMEQLESFESLPFEAGEHGKAAVRVVDDAGTTSEVVLDLVSS